MIKLVKPIIRSASDGKKMCQFKIEHPKLGKLNMKTVPQSTLSGYGQYEMSLTNASNYKIGYEIFTMENEPPQMLEHYIQTDPKYRGNNYFVGELLRLSSIITMIENKMKEMEITSLKSAVFFHAKYKFVPDITQISSAKKILSDVIVNTADAFLGLNTDALRINKMALALLDKVNNAKNTDEYEALCRDISQVTDNYLKTVIQKKGLHKLQSIEAAIPMKLTTDEICKNKTFFDKLFEKHGIDYKI